MSYDAVLRNLAVIGEAVRALPAETRDQMPDVPWAAIAGLRNIVVHEYFRVDRELVLDIAGPFACPGRMAARNGAVAVAEGVCVCHTFAADVRQR